MPTWAITTVRTDSTATQDTPDKASYKKYIGQLNQWCKRLEDRKYTGSISLDELRAAKPRIYTGTEWEGLAVQAKEYVTLREKDGWSVSLEESEIDLDPGVQNFSIYKENGRPLIGFTRVDNRFWRNKDEGVWDDIADVVEIPNKGRKWDDIVDAEQIPDEVQNLVKFGLLGIDFSDSSEVIRSDVRYLLDLRFHFTKENLKESESSIIWIESGMDKDKHVSAEVDRFVWTIYKDGRIYQAENMASEVVRPDELKNIPPEVMHKAFSYFNTAIPMLAKVLGLRKRHLKGIEALKFIRSKSKDDIKVSVEKSTLTDGQVMWLYAEDDKKLFGLTNPNNWWRVNEDHMMDQVGDPEEIPLEVQNVLKMAHAGADFSPVSDERIIVNVIYELERKYREKFVW